MNRPALLRLFPHSSAHTPALAGMRAWPRLRTAPGLLRGHAALMALFCTALAAMCLPRAALALSYCASDGQAAPMALVERFISADCAACWSEPATLSAPANSVAIDWVLPGSQGDDAPLSAIASRDAQARWQALGLPANALVQGRYTHSSALPAHAPYTVRVAHGLPVNDYIGTSIEAKAVDEAASAGGAANAPAPAEHAVWLLLVEHIPAGTEGTPVARNIARNSLQGAWNMREQLLKNEQPRFYEARPMQLAPGAQATRLGVVGWLQDASGAVLAAARSRCEEATP